MKKTNRKQSGSSLLEILLYIALLAVIMLPIMSFVPVISEAKTKNVTISEVDQQGLEVSRLITQTIRNADAINLPLAGSNSTQLSLQTTPTNPTTFDISSNTLRINENGAIATLTSPQVTASDLTFFNYSAPNTPGIIRFQFTLSYKNTLERQEYNYSKIFTGSGSLR